MVAESDRIRALPIQLLGNIRRDADSAGAILSIDDREKGLVHLQQAWQAFLHGRPTRLADDVSQKQNLVKQTPERIADSDSSMIRFRPPIAQAKSDYHMPNMKFAPIVLTLSLVAAAIAIESPAEVKAAIQKQMSAYANAIKAKNIVQVESVIKANFTADFKDTDTRGTIRNREQTIQAMRANVSALKTVNNVKLTIDSIKLAGDKATTTEHFILDATMTNPTDMKKTSVLKVDSSWTGSYVKKGGKWLCVSSRAIKETVTVDGKKMG